MIPIVPIVDLKSPTRFGPYANKNSFKLMKSKLWIMKGDSQEKYLYSPEVLCDYIFG